MIETTNEPHQGDEPASPPPPRERKSALARFLLLVAAVAAATVATGTTKTVAVVVALIVMIMLHEFGHFVTAKWGGMKVTEFFVGFGPRLWSFRKGETEYGFKAIPAGGYVKIIGMNNLDKIEDPADEPRTYRYQSFPRRLAVAVAGSAMHFLIAFLLLFLINAVVGVPRASLTIGEITRLEASSSPAEEAGFAVGDRIVSIDGRTFESWSDIPPYIRSRPGQPLRFVVQRGERPVELVATPADLAQVEVEGLPATSEPTGFVGIGPEIEFAKRSPVTSVGLAAQQFWGGDFPQDPAQVAPGLLDNAKALAGILSPSGLSSYWRTIQGQEQADRPDGGARFLSPVGFVRVAGQAADTGLFQVLLLLIAINLFVGLFNLLPLLPLDGGHVAIAVYEAARSKITGKAHRADVAKLLPLTYAVVLVMVFLGISALYLDIVRPLNFR